MAIIVCGLSAELLLRGPLHQGAPDQVARALSANIGQLRLGRVTDTVMLLADIALALVFFGLLRPISEALALAALVFRLGRAVLVGAIPMALFSPT